MNPSPAMGRLLPALLFLGTHCAKEPIPFEAMYPDHDASDGDGDTERNRYEP